MRIHKLDKADKAKLAKLLLTHPHLRVYITRRLAHYGDSALSNH
jgi:hypothetical protein